MSLFYSSTAGKIMFIFIFLEPIFLYFKSFWCSDVWCCYNARNNETHNDSDVICFLYSNIIFRKGIHYISQPDVRVKVKKMMWQASPVCQISIAATDGLRYNILQLFYWIQINGISSSILQELPAHSNHIRLILLYTRRNPGLTAPA